MSCIAFKAEVRLISTLTVRARPACTFQSGYNSMYMLRTIILEHMEEETPLGVSRIHRADMQERCHHRSAHHKQTSDPKWSNSTQSSVSARRSSRTSPRIVTSPAETGQNLPKGSGMSNINRVFLLRLTASGGDRQRRSFPGFASCRTPAALWRGDGRAGDSLYRIRATPG